MINDILDPSEKILWEGKPDKYLYVLGNIQSSAGLVAFAVLSYFLVNALTGEENGRIILILSAILILLVIAGFIYRFLNWKKVNYVVTDKRIYIESGVVGRDIDLVELLDVKEPRLSMGIIERSRGKGSIYMNPYVTRSNRRRVTRYAYCIQNVSNAQDVFMIVKQQTCSEGI